MVKNRKNEPLISLGIYLVMLVINTFGVVGIINGMSQAEVSAKYPTLITPAGYAFSIWSAIYLTVTIFIVSDVIFAKKKGRDSIAKRLHPWFWLSCLFNVLWIIAFSYEWMALSVLLIVGMLVSLYQVNQIIKQQLVGRQRLLSGLAFGLYEGWVTVATIVNIAAFLVSIGWQGFGITDSIWSVIVLTVGVLIISLRQRNLLNPLYSFAGAWAYFAIYIALTTTNQGLSILWTVTLIESIYLAGLSLFVLYKNQWMVLPPTR